MLQDHEENLHEWVDSFKNTRVDHINWSKLYETINYKGLKTAKTHVSCIILT